jgi:hypothetical protein
MIRLMRSFCTGLLIIAATALPAIAQDSKTVTSEGVAAIEGNARGIAREAALEDAQKRAVEQAIAILIDSQIRVENYQLISNRVLTQIKRYIKRYTITGENTDSGLLRIRINAEIALGRLNNDLSGIGILPGRVHKPRTMVMVAEQNIGREVTAWWLGTRGEQTEVSVVENAFMDKFTKKGFEFIDHQIAIKKIAVTGADRTLDLTEAQAVTLAAQADAEVVIIGKASTRFYGDIGGGMKSVQADLTARAVRIDTGRVIATTETHAAAVHMSEITAGTAALDKAANQAAEEMIGKILAVYSGETAGTRSVNITIAGLNKTQFAKFKDVLLKQVQGIKDLHERSFNGTTARISVDSKNSTQKLSDEILLRDFGVFSVEVVGSTASSLELQVTPK